MRRSLAGFFLFLMMVTLTPGCNAIGSKAASLSAIYGTAAIISLLLLIGYCIIVKKKDLWFLVLFTSVLVVNVGYFALAVSRNLNEALLANRLAYLGSVFLPMSMWMIIANVTRIQYPKWLPWLLTGISMIVFLIAASPGYLDIYYKEVFFEKINGVTVLRKIYGPLHGLYLIYLLGYFGAMVTTIIHAAINDKIDSMAYAVILAIAVFVNIGVWMIEQLVQIDFEILSVSYIISELFLLGLHLFMVEIEKQKDELARQILASNPKETDESQASEPPTEKNTTVKEQISKEEMELFVSGIFRLTPKEQQLYECYVAGMSTSEIMENLNIKENTLKFHNKNLYSKLGVKSRKQLMKFHWIAAEESSQ